MQIIMAITFGRLAIDILSLKSSTRWTLEKSSKNPIQKSKFFNLADMFGYKTMPTTDVIANDLNGRTWEEF